MARVRPATPDELERQRRAAGSRSQLVGIVAFVLLLAGLLLGPYTLLVPALLGLFLLSASGTFVSMRLNPFSVGFYAGTKPSWLAIALVAVCGLLLLSAAWSLWRTGTAPILPAHLP